MIPLNLLFIEGKHNDTQSVGTSITSIPDDAIVTGTRSYPDECTSDLHSDSLSANICVRNTPNLSPIVVVTSITSIPYDAHWKDPSMQIVTDSLKVQPGADIRLEEKKLSFQMHPVLVYTFIPRYKMYHYFCLGIVSCEHNFDSSSGWRCRK